MIMLVFIQAYANEMRARYWERQPWRRFFRRNAGHIDPTACIMAEMMLGAFSDAMLENRVFSDGVLEFSDRNLVPIGISKNEILLVQ